MRGAWGPSTSRLEQSNKRERHHTLTQNLKVMSLWVLLLIRCSTFTYLSDVGHITHTCTQHSPSSVSPFIQHVLPSNGNSNFACIVVVGFSANGPTRLCRRCCFLRKRTATSVVPFVEPGSDTTVGSGGEPGGPSTSRLEQPNKRERHRTLTQNLKAMGPLNYKVFNLYFSI